VTHTDVVRDILEEVGLAVGPEELELLTAARDMMRRRAASLYLPEVQEYEPADVFSAREQT
jgi:hypothetical protein